MPACWFSLPSHYNSYLLSISFTIFFQYSSTAEHSPRRNLGYNSRIASHLPTGVDLMAVIFEGKCDECGETIGWLADRYLACRLDSGEIVPIPHPGEFIALKRLGFAFDQARNQGRLQLFECVVCNNCGKPCYRPSANGSMSWGSVLFHCLGCLAIWIVSFWLCDQIGAMPQLLRMVLGCCMALTVIRIVGAVMEQRMLISITDRHLRCQLAHAQENNCVAACASSAFPHRWQLLRP